MSHRSIIQNYERRNAPNVIACSVQRSCTDSQLFLAQAKWNLGLAQGAEPKSPLICAAKRAWLTLIDQAGSARIFQDIRNCFVMKRAVAATRPRGGNNFPLTGKNLPQWKKPLPLVLPTGCLLTTKNHHNTEKATPFDETVRVAFLTLTSLGLKMKMILNIFALDKFAGQLKSGLLLMAALVLLSLMLLPGIPHVFLVSAAALAGGIVFYLIGKPRQLEGIVKPQEVKHPGQIDWDIASEKADLGIKIGSGLFPLVEERKGAPLMKRIIGIQHQISQQLGFTVPLAQIKVDLSLEPNSYRIMMGGMVLGADIVWPEDLIAIADGNADPLIEGCPCKDPTFGMDALWISADKESQAVTAGYTVVDASTVIATHLNDVVWRNAEKLFGMDEARKLLELLEETSPQLVDSLMPRSLSLYAITAICRDLLAEKVPLKDFLQICQAMLETSSLYTETPHMVDAIRPKIGHLIVQAMVPVSLPLPVMTVDAELEGLLINALKVGEASSYSIEPALAQTIIEAVDDAVRTVPSEARNVALITSPVLRRPLGALLKQRFQDLTVLSYQELPEEKSIEVLTKIGVPQSSQPMAVTDSNQM